jgi:Ca-activated chloride channel family protein
MRPCNNAVFAALLVGATLTLGAQEKLVPSTPAQAVPRTVLLSVSVTDSNDRLYGGLKQDNFKIDENDRPQQIATFARADEPFSIGIVLDLSGSMRSKIIPALQAIMRFLRTANPQDEFFVVGFNDRPELIQDFTNSPEAIQARLETIRIEGKTALFDALDLGLAKMKEARYQRKALLVVSDGADNRSNISEGKLREEVRKADVLFYTMGIFDPYAPTPEERSGPQLLDDLSEETGGRMFRVDDLAKMDEIAVQISTELRYRYFIGYQPSDPTLDGKWRKVKVKINSLPGLPRLNIHARTGYYAPLQ